MKNNNINRRNFLRGSGALTLAMRAAVTGLPASFLLTGAMPARAETNINKTLILAMSDDGESVNSYAPGAYSSNSSDPRFAIERPTSAELGTGALGTVNGNSITVNDFISPTTFSMGQNQVEGAQFFSYLPQSLLDRMSIVHMRTKANGHPEGQRVHSVTGALVNAEGRGSEEIQSAIMQEILLQNPTRPSILNTPMVLNGGGGRLATLNYEGVPITRYTPQNIKNLFTSTNSGNAASLAALYESTIDAVYQNVKTSGTTEQKRFLDAHASSRTQAAKLGDQLGALMTDVAGDSRGDQVKAAIAMAKVNLSPVIVIRYAYSRDNHGDSDLADEVQYTTEQLNNLVSFWELAQAEGMQDDINYATYDIFGRTHQRNSRGGRDHHNSSCVNMMIGSNVNPGVIGGLEEWTASRNRLLRATSINSSTGLSTNADIDGDDTLASYAKTLMGFMGIPQERIESRITAGETISAMLKS